jgi:hypothetical protein
MSTKIYTAWKIPQEKLNVFIDVMHKDMFDKAVNYISTMADALVLSEEGIQTLKRTHGEGAENDQRKVKELKVSLLLDMCEKAAAIPERTPVDVECGINLWLYEKHFFCMPIHPRWMGMPENLSDRLDWAEDFSYWNNTDRPEHLTEEEWDQRGFTWNQINCGEGTASHNARRLYHSVVEFRPPSSYISKAEIQMALGFCAIPYWAVTKVKKDEPDPTGIMDLTHLWEKA